MRLFLFGASVFYLLGLKLTSHIEAKSSISAKPAIIESKAFPEFNNNAKSEKLGPELIKKDTAISAETKNTQSNTPSVKTPKNKAFPKS